MKLTSQELARITLGWQCPDCFGPNVNVDKKPFSHTYECQDCGSRWQPETYANYKNK